MRRECIIRQENNFTQMGSIILAIRLASIDAHLAILLDIFPALAVPASIETSRVDGVDCGCWCCSLAAR